MQNAARGAVLGACPWLRDRILAFRASRCCLWSRREEVHACRGTLLVGLRLLRLAASQSTGLAGCSGGASAGCLVGATQ